LIDFDVETRGLQWYQEEHRVFLVQFRMPDGEVRLYRHPDDREKIQEILTNGWEIAQEHFRAWNSKFDLHHLEAAGYALPPPESWHDGMVEAVIVNETMSAKLSARAEALGYPEARRWEIDLHQWILAERKRRRKAVKDGEAEEYVAPNYSDVPWSIMEHYATEDVKQTAYVSKQYNRLLDQEPDLKELYQLERRVMGTLFDVERQGFPIDRPAAVRFEGQLLEDLDRKLERVRELAGKRDFNPAARTQLEEALRRRKADLRYVGKTKSGKGLSFDNENLSAVDDELAEAVLDWRGTDKMYGTYVRRMLHSQPGEYGTEYPFLAADDRIHPNYRQVGARTGRMSASEPNVQNWHRDDLRLRYLVRAEPGNVLISGDLDAIEMRLFAAFAGKGPLLDAIIAGEDMHVLAADMVGLEDFVRASGHVEPRRQRGKTFNYTMAYGGGARSVRKHFRVPQQQAREMIGAYRAAFPEIVALQDNIAWRLQERGYVKTPWGRRHHESVRMAYKVLNYLIQGTAADLFKDAIVRIHARGVRIVGLYHDEVLAEAPEADAERDAEIIRSELVDQPKITGIVPVEADVNIVGRWAWAKDPGFRPAWAAEDD
jgi:DNA polymerase I-like protein with 3'-5' exonuclease and polymerase domains